MLLYIRVCGRLEGMRANRKVTCNATHRLSVFLFVHSNLKVKTDGRSKTKTGMGRLRNRDIRLSPLGQGWWILRCCSRRLGGSACPTPTQGPRLSGPWLRETPETLVPDLSRLGLGKASVNVSFKHCYLLPRL